MSCKSLSKCRVVDIEDANNQFRSSESVSSWPLVLMKTEACSDVVCRGLTCREVVCGWINCSTRSAELVEDRLKPERSGELDCWLLYYIHWQRDTNSPEFWRSDPSIPTSKPLRYLGTNRIGSVLRERVQQQTVQQHYVIMAWKQSLLSRALTYALQHSLDDASCLSMLATR